LFEIVRLSGLNKKFAVFRDQRRDLPSSGCALDVISGLESSIASLTSAIEDLRRRREIVTVPCNSAPPELAPAPSFFLDSVTQSLLPLFGNSSDAGKVVAIGPSVGKTCFIDRVLKGMFASDTHPSLGITFRLLKYHNTPYNAWDTARLENYRGFSPSTLRELIVSCFFSISHLENYLGKCSPGWS
jgi:hypothetical protein